VLIVGAGTGLDLPHLPSSVQVTATDLTPGMVKRISRRADALHLSVDARVMDGQALTFASESFDCVILHLIVAVIPDPHACMQETARVLRPGGRVAIFDKFLRDGRNPSRLRQFLNIGANAFFSDLNRRAEDVFAEVPLRIVHREPALMGGMFQIIIAEKGELPCADVMRS
jgi:ubiquinone/menaquinone biosynthesis C-methylase UbiE